MKCVYIFWLFKISNTYKLWLHNNKVFFIAPSRMIPPNLESATASWAWTSSDASFLSIFLSGFAIFPKVVINKAFTSEATMSSIKILWFKHQWQAKNLNVYKIYKSIPINAQINVPLNIKSKRSSTLESSIDTCRLYVERQKLSGTRNKAVIMLNFINARVEDDLNQQVIGGFA